MSETIISETARWGRACGTATTAAAAMALLAGGCASAPVEPVAEKLDPDTATTVTVLNSPIELFDESASPKDGNAFAFLGPFQTNRMGDRALFLWVAAPETALPMKQPEVSCDKQPIALQPLSGDGLATTGSAPKKIDLSRLSLSRPPYDPPVPWISQWYFRLPPEGLKCLATAERIAIQTQGPAGGTHRFTVDRKDIASLDAFTGRE